MSTLRLNHAYEKLFSSTNTLGKKHFTDLLKIKQATPGPNHTSADFRHGEGKLSAMRQGKPVDPSFAAAIAMFAIEVSEGQSEFAKQLLENAKYSHYEWADDFKGLAIDEAIEKMFVPAHSPAFGGTFTEVVQKSINDINVYALKIAPRSLFRLNESHAWMKDVEDAEYANYRMCCTAGEHHYQPAHRRHKLTDKQRMDISLENWSFDITMKDWDRLFRVWHDINPFTHIWSVKWDATDDDKPEDVRISNLSTLSLKVETYRALLASHIGVMDLTDPEMFQHPSRFHFIVSAAENPRATLIRSQKRLAEATCLLNQFSRLVPPPGHPEHGQDLHILAVGGTPETANTLRTKRFTFLNKDLKEGKPGKAPLFELIVGGTNYALKSLRDEIYRYQEHLLEQGIDITRLDSQVTPSEDSQ